MKNSIKTLAMVLVLSGLTYGAGATGSGIEDPVARSARIISEATAQATQAAARTREQREAELRDRVHATPIPGMDTEFAGMNPMAAKLMGTQYKKAFFSIDDRTAELNAEVGFLRGSVQHAYGEIADLTSQHTRALEGKDVELAELARTLAARDTRIAELEAALAVERRVNEENARSQAIIRDLIIHSQGARSRAPSADPGRRPQVAPAATVTTPAAASSAASTVVAPGAPQ